MITIISIATPSIADRLVIESQYLSAKSDVESFGREAIFPEDIEAYINKNMDSKLAFLATNLGAKYMSHNHDSVAVSLTVSLAESFKTDMIGVLEQNLIDYLTFSVVYDWLSLFPNRLEYALLYKDKAQNAVSMFLTNIILRNAPEL